MSKHLDRHFEAPIPINMQQLTGALSRASEHGAKFGSVDVGTWQNLLPMKKKNKPYKWLVNVLTNFTRI